ncbi:hypothetical protein ACOMHN_054599 [Nucella lapillus]
MADPSFLSRHYYVLLAFFVISDVTMVMTSSMWNNVGKNIVTSSMATSNTSRVATRCVMECDQMESCVSLAFDPESDICYLQLTYRQARQGDDGPLDVYTREKVSECKLSEAPDVTKAHVTNWRVTSSSLDGDVSCDEDFMLSEDETPRVRCQLDTGVWTTLMNATCKQFAWRNYTVLNPHAKVNTDYLLPRPATVGLCVRVKGTPTKNDRFAVNQGASHADVVLHVSARLNGHGDINTIAINYKQGNHWSTKRVSLKDPTYPFPFAVSVPFEMTITAVSLNTFRVQINGVHYTNYTGGLPVTDVIKVFADGDVSIEELIIGC